MHNLAGAHGGTDATSSTQKSAVVQTGNTANGTTSSIASSSSHSQKVDLFQLFKDVDNVTDLENLSGVLQQFLHCEHHESSASLNSAPSSRFITFHPKKGPIPLYLQAKSLHSSCISLLHTLSICSLNSVPVADMIYFQYWDLCLKRDSFVEGINERLRWVILGSFENEFSLAGHLLIYKQGPFRLLDLLIRDGLDLNARDGKAKETVLHLAVRMGDVRLVKHLLQYCNGGRNQMHGVGKKQAQISHTGSHSSSGGPVYDDLNVDVMNVALKTPLIVACENGSCDIVKLLLSRSKLQEGGSGTLLSTFSPIEIALDRENPEILTELFKVGMDPNHLIGGKKHTVGQISTKEGFEIIPTGGIAQSIKGTPLFVLFHRLFFQKHSSTMTEEISHLRILRMIDVTLQQSGADLNMEHSVGDESDTPPTRSPRTPSPKKLGSRSPNHSTHLAVPATATKSTPLILLKTNLSAHPKLAVELLATSLQQNLNFSTFLIFANTPKSTIRQHCEHLLNLSLQSKVHALTPQLIKDALSLPGAITQDTLLTAMESGQQENTCIKLFSALHKSFDGEFPSLDYGELIRATCENGMPRLLERILHKASKRHIFSDDTLTEAAIAAVCSGFIQPVDVLESKNYVSLSEVIQFRDFNENSPLHLSVNNAKLKPKEFGEMLKRLKEHDFSLSSMNNDFQTAADVCVTQVRRFDLILELAHHGVDISRTIYPPFDDNSVALCAATTVSTSEFKRLVNASGGKRAAQYKNRRGTSALHVAVQHNHTHLMRVLLADYEVDVNVLDENQNAPIHYATTEEALELLLEFGASPNRLNSSKETPLHKICQACRLTPKNETQRQQKDVDFQLVRILLENGADPNLQDSKGCTPLHYACLGIHAKSRSELDHHIFRLLIDWGCDCRAQNNSGDTPLHLTLHRKLNLLHKKHIISMLLKRGARINEENKDHLRPIHFFEGRVNKRNQDIIEIMVKQGADYDCSRCFSVMKDAVGFMKQMDALMGQPGGKSIDGRNEIQSEAG